MSDGSRIWAALVGAWLLAGPLEASAAEAQVQAGRQVGRVSSKSSHRHARRRKGTDATDPSASAASAADKLQTGEVSGGQNGHATKLHPRGQGRIKETGKARKVARVIGPKTPCLHDAVEFERGFGGDVQPVVLTRCDEQPAPHAIEQLSVLVRPMNAPKPQVATTPVRHLPTQNEWLPGVKLIHEGLIFRLQRVVDRFHAKRITIVSGYRPASLGSFHQSARAIDFHIAGVRNEDLVAFCRSIPDTGCGYYPNSSFVHMDVRAPKTGHVYWIDASGPGEAARYVSTWPPKDLGGKSNEIPRPDPAAPLDEQTHPDSAPHLPPGASDTKVDARTIAPLSDGDGKDDPFAP